MIAGLLPEDELCLLLARGQLPSEVQARALDLLARPVRWDAVLQRAGEHHVTLLLYRSLVELEYPSVPGEVRATLSAAFRANALRNLSLAGELARLLRLLGEAGIRVIPLKGIALAQLLYGDPAFRVCSDLDILVPPGDVLAARHILLAHGYTSPFSDDFFLNHQFHTSADCPLFPRSQTIPYLVELQWTLFPHSYRDTEATRDLWLQAQACDFFGVQAYNLTPEWKFLYLAMHVASHKWQTLRWIADIHDLSVSGSINWIEVQEMAVRFDLNFVAESTLAVCSLLYDTPTPANFSSATVPAGVPLFPHSLDHLEAWKAPIFYPKLLPRTTDRLRWFAEMFLVARVADRRFLSLPASLNFLYYLLRPLRLTCKWSWRILAAGFRRMGRWLRFS